MGGANGASVRKTRKNQAGFRNPIAVWSTGLVLVAIAAFATIDLTIQWSVSETRGALNEQTGRLARGGSAGKPSPTPSLFDTPEAQVLDALRIARIAGAAPPGSIRTRLITRSTNMAADAAAARPNWGEAEVVQAYAASLGSQREDGVRARQAFAASYVDAPLLHDAGQWRIRFGAEAWSALDATTRQGILREGVWLLGVDRSRWPIVFATFRGTAAYVPFMLYWRDILSGPKHPGARSLAETQADD